MTNRNNKMHKPHKAKKQHFTDEEKEVLCDLICNEQIKHLIKTKQYSSNKYIKLERLKAKIRSL